MRPCSRQRSPTIRRAITWFTVVLVFVSRTSYNAAFDRSNICYQVLCETRQVSSKNCFYDKLTAFGDDSLSKRQVFRWHKAFLEGREEVRDEVHVGRMLTITIDENMARVRELLNTDRRLSVRLVSQTLNISKSTVYKIVMNDLQM